MSSFCRLCLAKNKNKVPIFGKEEVNVVNLLMLIELDIDPDLEADAVVCFDCIVTLEGFFQFKEQCHENDEFLKTHQPEDSAEGSEASDGDEGGEPSGGADIVSNEEEQVVETSEASHEEWPKPKRKLTVPAENPNFKRRRIAGVHPPRQDIGLKRVVRVDSPPNLDPVAVERRPRGGPTLDEMQVLQDSYPEYFYFEKGLRTQYFTLVYHGERYNSANFSERFTYWKCIHRKKHNCKALLVACNSYLEFERRHEHSHGEVKPDDLGPVMEYTPRQALPEVFKICRTIFTRQQGRRRKALSDKKIFQMEMAARGIQGEEVVVEDGIVQELNDEREDALTAVMQRSGILDHSSDVNVTDDDD